MQRWSASSSADDSDSSQETSLRPEERLKRRQRVKRRMLTRSASSDSSSDFIQSAAQQNTNVVVKEEETEKRGQEKSSSFQWSPLKNALMSLLTSPSKKSKPKPVHKKILRSPVTYMYIKGPSGLPTQRVPVRAANWQLADFYSSHNYDSLRALMLEM